MLARTHAASGLAAAAAALAFAPMEHPAHAIGWLTATTGAALLPDLDHPNSTATRAWGAAGRAASHVIHAAAGGHRSGTHDPLVAPPAAGLVGWLCSLHPIPAIGLLTLLAGLALRPLAGRSIRPGAPLTAAPGMILAGLVTLNAETLAWLPAAAALGVLLHIIGDAVTNRSIPVPLTWLRTTGPRRLGTSPLRTGGAIERWVIAPSCLAIAATAIFATIR